MSRLRVVLDVSLPSEMITSAFFRNCPRCVSGIASATESHPHQKHEDVQGSLVYAPVYAPVDAPTNTCGNTVNVIGLNNPAYGNSCINQ